MQVIIQNAYLEPESLKALSEEALVIHRRTERQNKNIILFVHGLGGERYGVNGTWGRFPQFIFEDFPEVDIGMYQYKTLLKRFRIWESLDLEEEARVLADIFRQLTHDYKNIILVGHSMGGLLLKCMIKDLIDAGLYDALKCIAGLILFATPQTGSQRVPRFLAWFSKDFRALVPHGRLVSEIAETFNDRVSFTERGALTAHESTRTVVIRTWAVIHASDLWVDRLSAGLHLNREAKVTVRGSHTSVVKPKNKSSDAYMTVSRWISQSLGIQPRIGILAAADEITKPDAQRVGRHGWWLWLPLTIVAFALIIYAFRDVIDFCIYVGLDHFQCLTAIRSNL